MQDNYYKRISPRLTHCNSKSGSESRISPSSAASLHPPSFRNGSRSRSLRRSASKDHEGVAGNTEVCSRKVCNSQKIQIVKSPTGLDSILPPAKLFGQRGRSTSKPQLQPPTGGSFLSLSQFHSGNSITTQISSPPHSSDFGLSPDIDAALPRLPTDSQRTTTSDSNTSVSTAGWVRRKQGSIVSDSQHPSPPTAVRQTSILASRTRASSRPASNQEQQQQQRRNTGGEMGQVYSCDQADAQRQQHDTNGTGSSAIYTWSRSTDAAPAAAAAAATTAGNPGDAPDAAKEATSAGRQSSFASFTRRLFPSRHASAVADGPLKDGEGMDAASPNSYGSPTDTNTSTGVDEIDDATWEFVAPPNNQRTFFFPEDNLEFSSEFDSGNLIQVERTGPLRYNMYTSMDCGNAPCQTNNRQWFHFSVRGGTKGSVVSVTMIGMMNSNMFTFDWMPVMAIVPGKPQYARLPGKALTTMVEIMPATPGYPLLVYKPPGSRGGDGGDGDDVNDDAGDDDDDVMGPGGVPQAVAFTIPVGNTGHGQKSGGGKKKKKKKKKDQAMNLTFDFKIEVEAPLEHCKRPGHFDCPAIYIASNHPYSYSTLQRNIADWKLLATGWCTSSLSSSSSPASPHEGASPGTYLLGTSSTGAGSQAIYLHRETLCKTLEGRNVELLTITDMQGIQKERMPMLSKEGKGIPYSSGTAGLTKRPFKFVGKQHVVLSARVHPGECAGSHIMHGSIEFLMALKDPRAIALRQRFVFSIVPMLNPDGVVRGHSRADACGTDLNRMYSNPSPKRHPAPYSLRLLSNYYANEKKLALFVDMHAHANKKGTFFYGNGMNAADQVQNVLYAKLVAMNTPYFEFNNCNFSESNMYAVGKAGKGKDSSSRVVLFHDTGFIHSYTIEASHVAGKTVNSLPTLSGLQGEDKEPVAASMTNGVRYSPETFGDTGKGLLLALLDLKGVNPVSRVPLSPYANSKGVALWIQRQMQIEAAEKLFAQAYREHGKVEPSDPSQTQLAAIMQTLTEEDIPDKVTLRNMRSLPPTTFSGLREFLSIDLATTLLAQTPPSGLPRSAICKNRTASPSSAQAHGGSPSTQAPPSVAVPVAAAPLLVMHDAVSCPPPVLAARRTHKTVPVGTQGSEGDSVSN